MAIIYCNILNNNYLLLFFILILTICDGIPYLSESLYPLESDFFDSFVQFFIYIPYFIWKIKNKKENIRYKINPIKKEKFSLKNKENIIFILVMICSFLLNMIYSTTDEIILSSNSLFNRYNIQIIFFSLLSKYSLNTRYYIHNLISQIIFEIFSLFADYFYIKRLPSYNIDFPHILIMLLDMLLESVVLIYKKYLIDIKYYSVEYVSFIFGLCNFIFLLFIEIINRCFGKIICLNNTCINIIKFNFSWRLIISFICCTIFYVFYYQIIYHFSPIHILIYYIIAEFLLNIESIFEKGNFNSIDFILIIAYIFIIINFLIFIEIIELNFCGLNKYTRRNITIRQKKETLEIGDIEEIEEREERDSIDDKKKEKEKPTERIDLPEGYSFELN